MSKYSFIEAELNAPGKQCFCVDINNSKIPFTYANPIANVTSNNLADMTNSENKLTANRRKKYDSESNLITDHTFLLSPEVRNNVGDKEKQIINTVNSLLTETVNKLDKKSKIIASNQIINNIPNNSLTTDNNPKVAPSINLNKMANSKKNYRSKSNIALFENFEQDKCDNTCSIKKKRTKKHTKKHRKSGL